MMTSRSPFKAIIAIQRDELPLALLMSGYFFLVITSFWVLKPLKKSLFIQFYDQSGFALGSWTMTASQAELLAKVLNMVVAFAAVVVFTWLVQWFRRQQLTFIFSAFFLLSFVAYSFIVDYPGGLTVWSFYLFGDLYATLMVATFFAFLNDSVTPDAAKRLYGLIGLGGVVGGVFGSTTVRGFISTLSLAGWLWVCVGLGLLIIAVAYASGRIVAVYSPPFKHGHRAPHRSDAAAAASSHPALAGARLVFASPYLLSIVAIVGLYEIVSTVMDFQFTSTIAHYLDGPAIGKQFSTIFAITNVVAMCVQLFLTSFIMTRLGVEVALLVLPIAILVGSGGFLVAPLLWVGSLLNTADNGFSYSINQSAKEALYVPTSQDEKYKAKAFIDMFVQRFAKAIAVVLSLGISTLFDHFASLRWLSVFTVLITLIWVRAAHYAGKRFRMLADTTVATGSNAPLRP
jgi:AAA family ATP:ADP antiporter